MTKHTRANAILEIYRSYFRPLVDREVMEELGFRDPNAVRPRVTEMIHKGILKEVGKREDGITHKKVRLVTVVAPRTTKTFWQDNMDEIINPVGGEGPARKKEHGARPVARGPKGKANEILRRR